MKQFKLLILLLVIGFVGEAQINYLPIKSRYKLIAGLFDSTLHIPSGTTPGLRTGGYDYRGAVFYRTSDSTVYVYTGTQWITVKGAGGSSDSTIFATLYRLDTAKTNLRASLATKLNISDTVNMRPRLYAGSNVTITGTYPNLTIASSGGGSSDTSTFIVDTTYNRLAYAISADSLWLKSARVQLNGVDITPTTTDSTLSWNIQALVSSDTSNKYVTAVYRKAATDSVFYVKGGAHTFAYTDSIGSGGGGGTPAGNYGNIQINRNGAFATPASDSLNYSGGLAIKGTLSATAIPTGGVAADSLLMVTSAGVIKKRNSSDYVTGSSLVTGRFALVNGTGSITSSSKFNYSDATYPTMSMIGSDPLFYIGPSATLLNNPAFGHSAGAVIYGGATYKGVQLVDQISGGIQMARFYNSGGTIYNNLNGLITSNTLSSPSNYQGSFTIQRTVPYSAGLNYHGFTDQTVFNSASTAFNSFGSFATIGNDRSTQNHYAAFQSVWYKDSSNTVLDVYDFVSAVSEMREGTIDTLFRFKVFELTKSGGTINVQYGIHIPDLNTATTNYGAYIENNVGIGIATPTEKLHVNGNIKTGDPGSGAGSWKLGTAVTTSGLTLNTTTYVEVSIGGTVYRLAVVDPPQP